MINWTWTVIDYTDIEAVHVRKGMFFNPDPYVKIRIEPGQEAVKQLVLAHHYKDTRSSVCENTTDPRWHHQVRPLYQLNFYFYNENCAHIACLKPTDWCCRYRLCTCQLSWLRQLQRTSITAVITFVHHHYPNDITSSINDAFDTNFLVLLNIKVSISVQGSLIHLWSALSCRVSNLTMIETVFFHFWLTSL